MANGVRGPRDPHYVSEDEAAANLFGAIFKQAVIDAREGSLSAQHFLRSTMEESDMKRLLSNADMNKWIRAASGHGPPAPPEGEPAKAPTANAGEGRGNIPDTSTTGQKMNQAIRILAGRGAK